MKNRPEVGTLEWFDSLSKRDFDNGATLDEIAKVFKERDELRKQLKRALFDVGWARETPLIFGREE